MASTGLVYRRGGMGWASGQREADSAVGGLHLKVIEEILAE